MSCRMARISCASSDIAASIVPSIQPVSQSAPFSCPLPRGHPANTEWLLDREVCGYLGLFVLESQQCCYFGTRGDLDTLGLELIASGRRQHHFRLGSGINDGQLGSEVGTVDLL